MTAVSPVTRFRKRPVVISAIRWTGDNEAEVREFAGGLFGTVTPEARGGGQDITAEVLDKLHSTWVGVKTGQWVVRGVKGELYPLDDEVRLETYDPAGDTETDGLAPGEGELAAARLLAAHAHEAITAAIGRAEAAEEAKRAARGELAALEDRLAAVIADAVRAERERGEAAARDAAGAERKRIRELADRNGAVCAGDEGTGFFFSALLADKPEEAPDA